MSQGNFLILRYFKINGFECTSPGTIDGIIRRNYSFWQLCQSA